MKDSASVLFAARLLEDPSALELVRFSLTGMLVVLLSLALLALFCKVVGYILRRFAPRAASTSRSVRSGDLPDESVAVIAAAVSEAVAAPHRIVHIRGLTPEDMNWSLEGRMQHHASHKPSRQQH